MECVVTHGDGRSFRLPRLLEWSFSYGCGKPCDCFEVSVMFESGLTEILESAVRFEAREAGETIFTGLIDEAEIKASREGASAFIRGRGLQALLLDNEAESAQFFSAGLETVLEKHVYPFGVRSIRRTASPGSIALNVSSGESAWRALEEYMRFSCGIKPRFLRDGTLLLGEEQGKRLEIDANTALCELSYTRRRYGVISEVLVKNKAAGTVSRVLNRERADEGGMCRRVVNVPRYTHYDAMRSTGEYQISASKERERVIRLTLLEQFAAFPGDVAELSGQECVPEGTFFVEESRCFGNAYSAGTELTLTRRAN